MRSIVQFACEHEVRSSLHDHLSDMAVFLQMRHLRGDATLRVLTKRHRRTQHGEYGRRLYKFHVSPMVLNVGNADLQVNGLWHNVEHFVYRTKSTALGALSL